MALQFTPAAQRVLDAATRWRLGEDPTDTGPVELLLGLLDEPEYRAAGILAGRGIDQGAVQGRWPAAHRAADPKLLGRKRPGLAMVVDQALEHVLSRLDSGRGFPLATEHLLLGLTVANHEVAGWLAAYKLESSELEADICARYGISLSPMALEFDDQPIPLAEAVSSDSKIIYTDAIDNLLVAQSQPAADLPPPVRNATNLISSRPLASGSPPAGEARGAEASVFVGDDAGALLRIFDAAANRAGEAVRVVEDYVRFALDDALLTRFCKEIRHELKEALGQVSALDRLRARDTPGDVGTSLSTEGELRRENLFDVAAANVRRLQESLRSLEEFGKLVDPRLATACERLRYRSYTLHQIMARTVDARARLEGARSYVLVDGRESPEAFERLVSAVIAGGANVVQLRDKRLDDRTLLERAARLRRLTQEAGVVFIMNDRPDLAVAAAADGVHVGQEEIPVRDARRLVGPHRLVGVSTHSIEQVRRAVLEGADYLGLGPTFPSGTKQFERFPGLDFLREAAAETKLPAFAIGGITAENAAAVVAAGIGRVALSGAVINAADPTAALREIRRLLPA
jgi:thiamine-phosphate pyrophosphorylase